MTRAVITAGSLITVRQAARTMRDARIRHLPIVDGHGRLLGMVTYADLLRIFLRDDALLRQHIVDHLLAGRAGDVENVDVHVKDGQVIVTGRLAVGSSRTNLLDAVRAIPGVVEVVDQLQPRRESSRRPRPYPAGARVASDSAFRSSAAHTNAVQSAQQISSAYRTA